MRGVIELFDSQGTILPDALLKLVCFDMFPEKNSGFDRSLMLDVLLAERARFREVGKQDWQPSEVCMRLIQPSERQYGSKSVCSYVVLALVGQEAVGLKPTASGAAKIVSRAFKQQKELRRKNGTTHWQPVQYRTFKDGSWIKREGAGPLSSAKATRESLSENMSIAPILVARLLAGYAFADTRLYEFSDEQTLRVVHTIAKFEDELHRLLQHGEQQYRFTDYWSVKNTPGFTFDEELVLPLTRELCEFIASGVRQQGLVEFARLKHLIREGRL